MPIKVLILEDDMIWRTLYRLLLEKDTDVEIIAEFETAEEALRQIPRLCPDVAVVDLSLPGMRGEEFAKRLKEYPAIKVIIVTAHDPAYVASLQLQEMSVVDKTYSNELLQKIKAIGAKQQIGVSTAEKRR
jgi:DNA-binding NarL/FixJ family response regulator